MTKTKTKTPRQSRSARITRIGFLTLQTSGSLNALACMLIADAQEGQTSEEAQDNAKIAYDNIGHIIQGLQEVRLGLSPIAGIGAKPTLKPS